MLLYRVVGNLLNAPTVGRAYQRSVHFLCWLLQLCASSRHSSNNVNTCEIAAECSQVFGVSDVTEAVACTRKDRFVNRYALDSSVVCEICIMCVVKFLVFLFSI